MKRILCVSAERRQIKNCIQWSMVAASAGDHYTHFIQKILIFNFTCRSSF